MMFLFPQVLTPAAKGMAGAVAKAESILAGLGPDGYLLQQFNNADNPKVYRRWGKATKGERRRNYVPVYVSLL